MSRPLALHLTLTSILTLFAAVPSARAATQFGQTNGLPNLAVSSLAFDRDGFLLTGTDRGLYRLEGDRFRPFGHGLSRESVRSLAVAPGGTVWAGTASGLWASQGSGAFQRVPTLAHKVRSGPHGMIADRRGNVYVTGDYGLLSCTVSRVCTWIHLGAKADAITIDTQGTIWAAGESIWKISPDGVPAHAANSGGGGTSWKAAAAATDGRVWFRSERSLTVWEPEKEAFRTIRPPERDSSPFPGLAAAAEGRILAASGESLWTISPADFTWRRVHPPAAHSPGTISALAAGPDGTPWTGIDGSGVSRYPGFGEWTVWTRASGLASDNVKAIHRDARGHIWIGAESFLYEWTPGGRGLTDGAWTRRVTGEWEKSDSINSILSDPAGQIWIGLESGDVVRWDPVSKRVARNKLAQSVNGLAIAGDTIVAVTERGPYGSRWSGAPDFQPESVDGPSNRLYALEQAPDGRLFAAGMGLLVREGVRWRQASPALSGQRLRRAVFGPGGSVWAGLHRPEGLERLEGDLANPKLTRFDSTNALLSDRVSFLGVGGDGRIWAGTDSGIQTFDGKWWSGWDQTDGLAWNHTNSRAFADGGDGTVWIGTARGIARFRVPESGARRLPVKIVRIEPGGRAGPEGLTFQPGTHSIDVEFAVPKYVTSSRISYQYRLKGIDSDWITVESPRVRFGPLAPGKYQLDVRARLDHGPWDSLEQPLRFRMEPAWWQSGWALLAYLAIGAGLLAAVIRLRTRAGLERERRLAMLIDERTRDLEQARDAAIEAGQAKAAFLAKMSHEIRTPLNGVIGTLGLLRGSYLDARQSSLTDLAIGSAENLMAVINSVLDFSKVESGRMNIESVEFALHDIVRSAVSLMQARATSKRLTLSCEISAGVPSAVVSDPIRLRQILLNLLSNAIKFTESGSVTVRVSSLDGTEGRPRARFDVTDTGIGIPAAAMGKLFRPFSQVDDSTTRLYGGTGLGLAICHQLCELMGGSIGVESEEGKGAAFWFELPFSVPESDSQASATATRAGASEKTAAPRILLAEDNPANRRVAEGMLEHLGLSCDVATDGRETLDKLSASVYDVVLLDCQMPEADGYEVARRVRAGETANPAIRIVALTANALQGDRERCLAAGMDDYLPKPLTPSALEDAIRGATRRM